MLRTIIQSFLTKGSIAVINFLILITTAKFMGLEVRGEISLVILNISIIQMVSEVYTGYSLVHFLARFSVLKSYMNGIYFALILTIITNIVMVSLNLYPINYFWFICILSLLSILNTFNAVIILSREFFKLYNMLSLIQPLILFTSLLVFLFVLHITTIDAFIWSLAMSFIIPFLGSTLFILLKILNNDKSVTFNWWPILRNGFFCQLAVLMYILSGKLSYYLFDNNADVGLFSTSTSLIESILIITNSVTPILLSKIANASERDKNINYTLLFAKLCFLFSLVAVIIVVAIPNELFIYVLGKDFSNNKDVMLLLSPGIILLSFTGIISNYFSGIGDLKTVSIYNTIGFIATLALSHLLIPRYGITGAAISTNISYLVMFIASIYYFKTKTAITFKRIIGIDTSFTLDVKNLFSGK